MTNISELNQSLRKAITANEIADVDTNTTDESVNELASKDSAWIDTIETAVNNAEFGEEPREVSLPEEKLMYLSKVDDGLFSGFVKENNEDSGNYGEVIFQFRQISIPSLVQALKTKGYIKRTQETAPEVPQTNHTASYDPRIAQLKEILQARLGDVHIHLHKSKKVDKALALKSLQELLLKAQSGAQD